MVNISKQFITSMVIKPPPFGLSTHLVVTKVEFLFQFIERDSFFDGSLCCEFGPGDGFGSAMSVLRCLCVGCLCVGTELRVFVCHTCYVSASLHLATRLTLRTLKHYEIHCIVCTPTTRRGGWDIPHRS